MRALARRGQGLPLNTIIVAIIVIVVLVVVILIFTSNIKHSNDTLQSCTTQGGTCSGLTAQKCSDSGGHSLGKLDCTTGVCCVTV